MTASIEGQRANAVLELLRGAKLPDEETADRLKSARDPDYWRELNPQLSVLQRHSAEGMEPSPLSREAVADIVDRFEQHGYIATPPLFAAKTVAAMREAIGTIHDRGWPEAFAFVYDEFWLAPRAPSVSAILATALGSTYRQLPHIWGHYVQPGSRGWSPHMDGPNRRGRVTIWISLSDAPLDGSCMYLVPADRTPPEVISDFATMESFSRRQVNALLQNARAVPAVAGSVLGWHQEVIHWGAPSYGATQPRISCSQEFISAAETAASDESPLIDPAADLPTLQQRLSLVGTAVLSYQEFEPLFIRYADLARGLLSE